MLRCDRIARSRDIRAAKVARLSARIADRLGLEPADALVRSQIVRLVEAYVTMTTAREDGPPLTHDDALWALWRAAGERYATEVVDALIEVAGRRRTEHLAIGGLS